MIAIGGMTTKMELAVGHAQFPERAFTLFCSHSMKGNEGFNLCRYNLELYICVFLKSFLNFATAYIVSDRSFVMCLEIEHD